MILRRVLRQKIRSWRRYFGGLLKHPKNGRLWDSKNLRYFATGDSSVGFTPCKIY
jgi:hypothetical protein